MKIKSTIHKVELTPELERHIVVPEDCDIELVLRAVEGLSNLTQQSDDEYIEQVKRNGSVGGTKL